MTTSRLQRLCRQTVLVCLFWTLAALASASCAKASNTHTSLVQHKTCVKNTDTYQYANGWGQPENEYLEATTGSCRTSAPWVLLIHGGSWINGAPSHIQPGVDAFYAAGWQVFNMEYRRTTSSVTITWNMQKDDAQAAYRWINNNATTFGLDMNRGTVAGFSAGGHIAAWLGNLKTPSSVLTISGVLQPQRVANDDNGARPLTEPSTPEMHSLHLREITMMGCDYGATSTGCADAWTAFDPETAITTASAPVYEILGDDDPYLAAPMLESYGYWLGQSGITHKIVHVPGYGHTTNYLWDSTSGSSTRWADVRSWITAHWDD